MTGTSGPINSSTSKPVSFGICTSRKSRSGLCSATAFTASNPFLHSATTSISSCARNSSRNTCRASSSSSTTIVRNQYRQTPIAYAGFQANHSAIFHGSDSVAHGILQKRLQQQRRNNAALRLIIDCFFHVQPCAKTYFFNGHEFFQQIQFFGEGNYGFFAHAQRQAQKIR